MTDFTNRPVRWSAQAGIVTGQKEGRRGKLLLTIALAGGRVVIVDSGSVEFTDVDHFAPATGRVEISRDHYGDVRRMSARW